MSDTTQYCSKHKMCLHNGQPCPECEAPSSLAAMPGSAVLSYRQKLVRDIGTNDICILLAWQRMAIRLGELWNAHIRLAKEHGDIGFIREQEAVAELRLLCATIPPNS